MMLARTFIVFLVGLSLSNAQAESQLLSSMPSEVLNGMPEDVANFIFRVDGCVHWTGEEPFDEERRAQIEKSVNELKCRDLQKDIKMLAQRHADAKLVVDNLHQVEWDYLIPSYDPYETERLTKDMPPDVVDLILRTDQCAAYQRKKAPDNADASTREQAMDHLRCKELRRDLTWLAEQYASSEAISKALTRLDEYYLQD
jgi:hypothetical protein